MKPCQMPKNEWRGIVGGGACLGYELHYCAPDGEVLATIFRSQGGMWRYGQKIYIDEYSAKQAAERNLSWP